MNQAAKWLTFAVAILVIGAIACVAIIRFTSKDTTSDAARARADSAILAETASSAVGFKVRVTSITSMGDQLWRVALFGVAPATKRHRLPGSNQWNPFSKSLSQ
jgi:hypothetical protein